ncbi:ATP-binding cassette, subfamily B, MsbA [Caldanaerobius fijiensis DSM 17918]|uniref:ATP-binding cassette, subfamily B, MsbA n=1 Tax=Caldanaerobius fijiensis DSM 17918 TaxID=1121256 RepID=A0A1M5E0W6_9THEO|nr:ABC transporter ATP-binding protein [Caldanaerobius fijiensis]SHF72754.1 ATP-binding cassette, subfamily B, MsbA [Caldanaerobius fijiensis DSM 17918]
MNLREVYSLLKEGAKYVKGKWHYVFMFIIFENLYTLLALYIPQINRMLINQAIPRKDINLLFRLALLVFATLIAMVIVQISKNYTQLKLSQYISKNIKGDLFNTIMHMTRQQLTERQVGDLLSRLFNDADRYKDLLQNTIQIFGSHIPALIIIIIVISVVNWKFAIVAIIFSPLFAISFFLFRKKLAQLSYKESKLYGQLNSKAQETVSGNDIVKLSGTETKEVNNFINILKELFKVETKEFSYNNTSIALSMFISGAMTAGIYVVGSWFSIKGKMNIGDIIALNSWVLMTGGPINQIALQYLNIQQMVGSVKRVLEVLNSETEIMDIQRINIERSGFKGQINFQDVCFAYNNNEKPILKGLSFSINPGERIGIVGQSGVGKSTIVHLLAGFYRNYTGKIFIDGYEVKDLPLSYLRKNIAVVSQEPILFNDTVANNILYGNEDKFEDEETRMKAIVEAAHIAGIHEKIINLPDGYNTFIGDRGIKLSGGEKQRIIIARMVIKNPAIILLDEAMSAIDAENEREIQEKLDVVTKGKTTLIISHRITTLRNVDRIMVLEDGKIADFGTHEELLRKNKLYARLYYNIADKKKRESI